MRWTAWLGLVAIAWLVASGQVSAQTGQTAGQSEQDEAARRNFKVGSAAFEAGQYEDALRYFEQAYALSPRPQLLYNIGQAADRLRHDERAIEAFEGYLAALPEAANRDEVENRVAALKRARAAEQQPQPTGPVLAAPEPEPLGAAPQLPADEPAARKPWFKQWWVWSAIGVVVAGGVATAVIMGRNEPADRSPTAGTTGVVTYALELR